MKKLLSFIIILASLLLVSCASTAPAGSTEPSWVTSIISTTASAQEATTAATATAETAATSATNHGGAVPVESFKPSGYAGILSGVFETRSKVMLVDFWGEDNMMYYYSKADGNFYPFCFNPLCKHSTAEIVGESSCLARALRTLRAEDIYYLNSRVYFFWWGSIYSCSEFATDIKLEYTIENIKSWDEFYAVKKSKRNGESSEIFMSIFGDGEYLFFKYVDPDGDIGWFRYNIVSKQMKRMNDSLRSLEEKICAELVVTDVVNGHIFMNGYKNNQFSGAYISDFDLKNVIKTEEDHETYTVIRAEEGIIKRDVSPYLQSGDKCSIILVKYDGTVETLVKDVTRAFEKNSTWIDYYDNRYLYFKKRSWNSIGYELSWHGYNALIANNDGKLYRYDTKTGKSEVVFSSDSSDYYDINFVEYYNTEEHIALLFSQTYVDTGERKEGKVVYELRQYLLKCHLDENGIVDGYEIVDFSEI